MNRAEARNLLGVEESFSSPQLKAAYRKMLKDWHPDLFSRDCSAYPDAIRRTQQINAAYRLLQGDSHRPQGTVETPSTAEWHGQHIRTIEWNWWPVRVLTSTEPSIPLGILVFGLFWVVLLGLVWGIETFLGFL